MRVAATLGILLFAAAGAAVALQFGGEVPARVPVVAKTKAALGEAADVTLEKTADYWLGAAQKREVGDLRGSGDALAVAIKLGRLEPCAPARSPYRID